MTNLTEIEIYGEKIYVRSEGLREIKQNGGVLRVYDAIGAPRFIEGTTEPLFAYIKPEKKADCPKFRPSTTNPEICAKWIKLPQKDPFCQVEEKCPSMGFRLTPRLDQEDDSFE